jgi:Cof subfamily protein (haloacid dehalogenase superfamily)
MHKKVVFLDIDGTMVDFDGKIPDSTVRAIQLARKNGHKMIICTGRSRYQIYEELLAIGFDGIVGAAGSYVECDGVEIFHRYIEEPQRRFLADYLEKNKFTYVIQSTGKSIVNSRCAAVLQKMYQKMNMPADRVKNLEGGVIISEEVWNHEQEEKAVYHHSPFSLEKVRYDLAPYFNVTALSFELEDNSGEIGIAGVDKSTGMQLVLDYYGLTQQDTIAVGDGPNDMEMIDFAAIGVAMGNARTELKGIADIITDSVSEDGIYTAFEKLKLI